MRLIDADALLANRQILRGEDVIGIRDYVTVAEIENASTIEPKIIRCKDCKHVTRCRSEESAKKFGQIYECVRNVFDSPKPEDYCSWAERRKNETD